MASPVNKDSSADRSGICRYPVALGQYYHIALNDFGPRNAQTRPVSHHQCPRACQIAQRFQHSFGARFLHDSDSDRHASKGQQNDRFGKITQQKIDPAAGQKQRQHRFAQNIQDHLKRRAALAMGKGIRPVRCQTLGSLFGRKPDGWDRVWHRVFHLGFPSVQLPGQTGRCNLKGKVARQFARPN
jgi:hypothetical protein